MQWEAKQTAADIDKEMADKGLAVLAEEEAAGRFKVIQGEERFSEAVKVCVLPLHNDPTHTPFQQNSYPYETRTPPL